MCAVEIEKLSERYDLISRRRRRAPIPVTLVLPAEAPTQDEIDAVLMATDSILGEAGRTGVTLILNGSRSKKALEWEWDQLDDYGRRGDGAARGIALRSSYDSPVRAGR